MGIPENLATPLLVNLDYFYFFTLKVSALSVSRNGSSFEFYVTKPFDEKICLSRCLLVSVSGQKAEFFFRTRKTSKVYIYFLLQSFGVAFHGLENHYSWTVLRLTF